MLRVVFSGEPDTRRMESVTEILADVAAGVMVDRGIDIECPLMAIVPEFTEEATEA